MTKDQIITKLKKNGLIKGNRQLTEYERAKRILLNKPMSPEEYEFKIKVISSYMGV